jgi:hypothetical protein
MPFSTLAASAQTSLNALAKAVGGVQPTATRVFDLTTGPLLSGQEPVLLVQQVATWAAAEAGRFVYYFEADCEPATLATLHAAAKEARDSRRAERKYARLFEPNRVLYVGGSASLRTRFREHLGYGHPAVYAMQLAYWGHVVDVPVRFTAARYAPTVSDEVLGALEDHLWLHFRPMMGRQGRK